MKVSIFYFSGTGNTLYTVEKFADFLSANFSTKLFSIEEHIESNEFYDADIIFLAYPIYMSDMPLNMKQFINDLPDQNKSIGTICTQAIFSGDGAYVAHKTLEQKGYSHTWSKQVNAFTNIGLFGLKPPVGYDNNDEILAKIDREMKELAELVYQRVTNLQDNRFIDLVLAQTQRPFYNIAIKSYQKKLYADNTVCRQCGACVRMCPSKAIDLTDEGIFFTNREDCLACLRCMNFCPVNAISTSKKKKKAQFKGPTKEIYTRIFKGNE